MLDLAICMVIGGLVILDTLSSQFVTILSQETRPHSCVAGSGPSLWDQAPCDRGHTLRAPHHLCPDIMLRHARVDKEEETVIKGNEAVKFHSRLLARNNSHTEDSAFKQCGHVCISLVVNMTVHSKKFPLLVTLRPPTETPKRQSKRTREG